MVVGLDEKASEELHKEVLKLNLKRIAEIESQEVLSKDDEYELENLKKQTPESIMKDCFFALKDKVFPYYMEDTPDNMHIYSLWIIGTYFHKQFNSYPYLFFNAMRGSGKSRILRLLAELGDGKWTSSTTESVIFRTKGLLCIDEMESINSKEKQALRELLNAAYKRGLNIMRMKKVSGLKGESQQVEEFECYRPICMANINGMDEVLGDRCISLILEKSNNPIKTCKIENFENDKFVQNIKENLKECRYVVNVTKKRTQNLWNSYISNVDRSININNIIYIHNINNILSKIKEEKISLEVEDFEFFEKVFKTKISGRNLELFFPLFETANIIGMDILDKTLDIARRMTEEKRENELNESVDVQLYRFVANMDSNFEFRTGISLLSWFRTYSGMQEEWINNKWFGRALKRLNLILESRRKTQGREYILNVAKAKEKVKMFEGGLKD